MKNFLKKHLMAATGLVATLVITLTLTTSANAAGIYKNCGTSLGGLFNSFTSNEKAGTNTTCNNTPTVSENNADTAQTENKNAANETAQKTDAANNQQTAAANNAAPQKTTDTANNAQTEKIDANTANANTNCNTQKAANNANADCSAQNNCKASENSCANGLSGLSVYVNGRKVNSSNANLSNILCQKGYCTNSCPTTGGSSNTGNNNNANNGTSAPSTGNTSGSKPSTGSSSGNTSSNSGSITAMEQQMVDLVNSERAKAGVAPLKVNAELTKVARAKAQDMIDNHYFDHTSPKYGDPFTMMKSFGISYRTAGENIAMNQTVAAAHTSLMNSQGHRENILKSSYTQIGIGIASDGRGNIYISQMFIG